MLPSEVIKKIKKIHIKSGRVVNAMMAGNYRSVFRGSGIEFEETREYYPGDDVRSIDWKVSARMGRPFIKLYREERELILMLVVDMSASGLFGTGENVKKDAIIEIAAILAFNAIKNNDKVGAILFTDHVEKYIPPQKGSAHIWRVIREIFTFSPKGTGTDIREAMAYQGRVCRKKTISFLISDFMTLDYMKSLKIASKKHELIGVMVSDPGEFALPPGGLVSARDLETGKTAIWDASHPGTRNAFEQMMKSQCDDALEKLKRADIDCLRIDSSMSPADALAKFFQRRAQRIR